MQICIPMVYFLLVKPTRWLHSHIRLIVLKRLGASVIWWVVLMNALLDSCSVHLCPLPLLCSVIPLFAGCAYNQCGLLRQSKWIVLHFGTALCWKRGNKQTTVAWERARGVLELGLGVYRITGITVACETLMSLFNPRFYRWHKDASKRKRMAARAKTQPWNPIRTQSWTEALWCQKHEGETEAKRVRGIAFIFWSPLIEKEASMFLKVREEQSLVVWTFAHSCHFCRQKSSLYVKRNTRGPRRPCCPLPSCTK